MKVTSTEMEKECCSYGAHANKKGAWKGQGVARVGMKIICNVEGKCCAPHNRKISLDKQSAIIKELQVISISIMGMYVHV